MAVLTSNQVCNICCLHYNAGLRCCDLGDLVEGGYLIARQGGLAWIVACSSRQVTRTWANRNNAVTVANASNACGDWFVPSRSDLQLGHDCKSFWDSTTNDNYWTSTERNVGNAWIIDMAGGTVETNDKTVLRPVRAFRRVEY